MWLSTWPFDGRAHFREHPSQPAAEQHAANLRARGHHSALAFWSEITEGSRTSATGAQGHERGEVAPESHGDGTGPTGAVFERESA